MRGKEILLSDMRGSLAGITASRNASGSFIRQRVSPIQPNSLAQIMAKTAFGAVAGLYRLLSAVERTSWSNFAKTIFIPKSGINDGKYTGQQAYQSIQASFSNSLRLGRVYNFKINGVIAPGGAGTIPFVGSIPQAPILASSTFLIDRAGTPQPVTLNGVNVKVNGALDVTIGVGNGSGIALDNIRNSQDKPVGIAVYMSSPNISKNLAFKNKEKFLLGYFPAPDVLVPADLDAVISFAFDTNDVFDVGVYQSFPVLDNFVMISVYFVTQNNQMNLIGRKEIQLELAP